MEDSTQFETYRGRDPSETPNHHVIFKGTADGSPVYEYISLTTIELHELANSFPFYEINIPLIEYDDAKFTCNVQISYHDGIPSHKVGTSVFVRELGLFTILKPIDETTIPAASDDFYSKIVKYILYVSEPSDYSPLRIDLNLLVEMIGENVNDNLDPDYFKITPKQNKEPNPGNFNKDQIERILFLFLNKEQIQTVLQLIHGQNNFSYQKQDLINKCHKIIPEYKYISLLHKLPSTRLLMTLNYQTNISNDRLKAKALGLVWLHAHGIISEQLPDECWAKIFK